MFWKYIEKINWKKEIRHIPFLKNKQLYINIEYKGYTWECGLRWYVETSFDSRGWWLSFTIFGVLFRFLFHDKRWYNENEGRFYLEDEPRWVDYSDPDYLQRVKDFMQKHPELKEGYYERVVQEMKNNQQNFRDINIPSESERKEKEKEEERKEQQNIQQAAKLMSVIKKVDWNSVRKAISHDSREFISRICEFQLQKGFVFFRFGYQQGVGAVRYKGKGCLMISSFANNHIDLLSCRSEGYLQDILPYYDLYDKKGNLVWCAADYPQPEPIEWENSEKVQDTCENQNPIQDKKPEGIEFESIKDNRKRFNDIISACGGTQGMIDKGIPWEKVAWGRTYWHGGEGLYFQIRSQKDIYGEMHWFAKNGDEIIETTKQDLAYSCDLYDNDGKLLSIMFWGL